MIFPVVVEDPKDKYKIGKVTEYRLTLPVQTVRFYTANPDEYIETFVETTTDPFTPEEVQGFFEKGNFKKIIIVCSIFILNKPLYVLKY